jgi:hypothetical protein
MRKLVGVLFGLALACPGPASAQSPSPTTPAHPAFPWGLGVAIPQGQLTHHTHALPGRFVRDIWVQPTPVVVEMMVATPSQPDAREAATESKVEPQYGVVRQSFMVPGYYVRETTVGFHYPERWILDQSYTWRLIPAEFRPHATVWSPGWPPAPVSVGTLGSSGSPAAPIVTPSLGIGSYQPASVPSLGSSSR